jgi:cell division protein FtsW
MADRRLRGTGGRRKKAGASKNRPGAKGKRANASPGKPRLRRPAAPVEYNLMLTATLILLAFGAVMVFSASSTSRILNDGGLAGSTFYLTRTLIAIAIGLTLMWIVMRMDLARIRAAVPLVMKLILISLCAVLVVGTAVNGTRGWFMAGPIQIQPAEFLKLGIVLYGAHLFANRPDRLHSLKDMAPFLVMTGLACGLVMLQPDMGTTMVALGAAALTLFVSGAKMRDLAVLGGGLVVVSLAMALVAPYRRQRLLTFLDPSSDVTGSGFQTIQAKIAIGSGGLDGVGIGNGVQKAFYLPEAHTDMISAVIGEEFGLLGMILLVAVYGLLGYAGFRIAKAAKDDFGRIVASGVTGLILIQASLNLYAVMGWAPLTGIPLPLVSYGNNSLVVMLVAIGLVLNVARGGSAKTLNRPKPARSPARGARLRLVEDGPETDQPARDERPRPRRYPQRQPQRAAQPRRRTAPSADSRDRSRRYGGTRSPGRSHRRRA